MPWTRYTLPIPVSCRPDTDDFWPQGIKQFWSNLIQSADATSAVLESIDVILAGDGAIEIGRATITSGAGGQAQTAMEMKYVVHWKQEALEMEYRYLERELLIRTLLNAGARSARQ